MRKQPHNKTRFLCAYSVERRFGGHEEGGWWFDDWRRYEEVTGTGGDGWEPFKVTRTVPGLWKVPGRMTDTHREKVFDAFRARFGWADRYGRYSVLGGEDFEAAIHDEKWYWESRETPHYE